MATETIDTGRNEVEIDLDKYTNLVLKLDEANDKIKEMERMSKELKIAPAALNQEISFLLVHCLWMITVSMKNP